MAAAQSFKTCVTRALILRKMKDKISLTRKLATFSDHWAPRTVATLNDYDIMVVKLLGQYTWHRHADTDELFLVLQGELEIEMRDRSVRLRPGDLFVVPKGEEHRPHARREVELLLIEPSGTPNSGDPETAAPRQCV
jgi:mannose-6-phosphate isomerase-like protein (cupin superfamily)